jgi:hypothetical protein
MNKRWHESAYETRMYDAPFPSSWVCGTTAILLKMDNPTPDFANSQGPEAIPSRPLTLVLISHSHTPPRLPAPHLKFDLRKLNNPPKYIRDAYDGRSKRLREHMQAGDEFCALLTTAQAKIEEQMLSFDGGHPGDLGESVPKITVFIR